MEDWLILRSCWRSQGLMERSLASDGRPEGDADVHESKRQAGPFDVRVHQIPERSIQRAVDVSCPRRGAERLLRLDEAADLQSRERRCETAAPHPCVVHS